MKKAEALSQQVIELEKKLGPEYSVLVNDLKNVDSNSPEGRDIDFDTRAARRSLYQRLLYRPFAELVRLSRISIATKCGTKCGKNIVGACWANDCNLAIFTLAKPGPRLGPMYAARRLIRLHNKAAGSQIQTGGFVRLIHN